MKKLLILALLLFLPNIVYAQQMVDSSGNTVTCTGSGPFTCTSSDGISATATTTSKAIYLINNTIRAIIVSGSNTSSGNFNLFTQNAANSSGNPLFAQIVNPLPAGTNLIGSLNLFNNNAANASGNPLFAQIVNPLPAGTNAIGIVSDSYSRPFYGEVAMTIGTTYTAGRSLKVIATVAGNVNVTYSDSSTGIWAVAVGTQTFPIEVISVLTSGTTATATYFNLK